MSAVGAKRRALKGAQMARSKSRVPGVRALRVVPRLPPEVVQLWLAEDAVEQRRAWAVAAFLTLAAVRAQERAAGGGDKPHRHLAIV